MATFHDDRDMGQITSDASGKVNDIAYSQELVGRAGFLGGPTAPYPPWVLEELRLRERFRAERQLDPVAFFPFFRPCRNRVLLVADGGLDFSEGDFGLSVFVRTLLTTPGRYVRHEVTLGHISAVGGASLMSGEARIANRIPSFRFDDPNHFARDRYDVVMLFGIATSYGGRGNDSNGNPYPADQLGDRELAELTAFMNGGGGLFATGDHGALGKALSAAVPRVRNMRLWDSTSAQIQFDQVSMGGPRRNDTNRGGLFDVQSDDVPQVITPKMYSGGYFFRVTFPHPLLCGPRGAIRVMPDHPHEGECIEPPDTSLTLSSGDSEYPPAIDGGARPVPEVISTSSVPYGNRGEPFGKEATYGQTFGGICAYDGHRAGVGRAITDATWHHFVNVNQVGMVSPSAPAFDKGFLTSLQGSAHLEDIRAYHRNLAVWASRPDRIRCMNTRLVLEGLFDGKVLEAVLTTSQPRLKDLSPFALKLVGAHARDALGRTAGQCESFQLVLDLVLQRAIPDLVPHIDPWRPRDQEQERPGANWVDGSALLDIALGAAMVALREHLGDPSPDTEDIDTDEIAEVMARGSDRGVELALQSLESEVKESRKRFRR